MAMMLGQYTFRAGAARRPDYLLLGLDLDLHVVVDDEVHRHGQTYEGGRLGNLNCTTWTVRGGIFRFSGGKGTRRNVDRVATLLSG
jgi:hypothetical protein